MLRRARHIAAASLALALGACGGGESPEPECAAGERCPCTTDFDCPDFFNEFCNAEFGQEGVCLPRSMQDTGDDADADVDAPADTPEDSAPDTVEDPIEDTSPDVPDTVEDTVPDTVEDTTDTSPDTADVADTVEDTTDTSPDTADDADADVDTGPPPGGYFGWIAVQTTAGPGIGGIHLFAGDRSVGPVVMPLPEGVAVAEHPDFSPTGDRLAYAVTTESASFIRIVTLASATWEDLFDAGEFVAVRAPRFAPAGNRLLFSARTHDDPLVWNIFVADAGSITALTELTDADAADEFVSAGAWSHDGTRVYYVAGVPGESESSSADLWSMSAFGGDATQVTGSAEVTSIAVSVRSDGTEVMFDTRADDGPVRRFLDGGTTEEFGLRNSDSSCVYYGDSDYAVCSRHQTAALEDCVGGDTGCAQDAVVVSLTTGATVLNLTRDIATRETYVAVTAQPYAELPIGDF